MPDTKNITSQEQKRPIGITILSFLYFLISLFRLLKFSQVILQWKILQKLPLTISPVYLAGDGLIWGLVGLILAGGLWTGKNWSSPAAMILSLVYSMAFWADRIWITESKNLAQRWPINLIFTIIGLGMIMLILNLKTTRDYFRENPAKIP